MVQIPRIKIESTPKEVIVGDYPYPRKIEEFKTNAKISPESYALIQEEDEANVAISMAQQFNNLSFFPMLKEASKTDGVLSTPRRFMETLVNVNSARRNGGVIYDALGNLIEKERLIRYTDTLNHHCWAYLNGRFPQEKIKGKGFRGLDFVTVGADGNELRAPLETCLDETCYVEIASINSQGFPTKKASVQKYKPGETVYFYPPVLRADNPEEGFVARFYADPGYAGLDCFWLPVDVGPSLGGFPCAEGALHEKIQEEK